MPGLLKVTMEGENFNSISLITMVLSVPPEAPFVVVVAADEEEPYFPPPPEDPPALHRRCSLQAQQRAQA